MNRLEKINEAVLSIIILFLILFFVYKAFPILSNYYFNLLYSEKVEETIKQNVKKECLK